MNWCSHMVVGVKISVPNSDLRDMECKGCPVCGTPKPVEKELAEKLYGVLREESRLFFSWGSLNVQEREAWRKVASVAEEHFKGKP